MFTSDEARWLRGARCILGLLVWPALAHGQVPFRFLDEGRPRGIAAYTPAAGMGSGIAAADYDADGDIDVFVPNGPGVADQLYQNQGNGTFVDVAPAVGVAETTSSRVALWVDTDGDHRLDLWVANDVEGAPSTYRLYHQVDGGQFVDGTAAAGLSVPMAESLYGPPTFRHRGGMCAGDINNDGFLDLYAGLWNGAPQLFLNNGDGTFSDITAASGVDSALWLAHQPVMHDFNGDGWQDIYVAIDFLYNVLFINQGDNTFVDVAPDVGLDNAMNDMGVTLGDYDNDGDFDIYITNIFEYLTHNVLLRNDSVDGLLNFVDQSEPAGCDFGGWGWGATFFDADNDGWLDIGATNGWNSENYIEDPSRFYHHRGDQPATFEDWSDQVGFNDRLWGSALIAFDCDRDGDLDLMQTCMNGPLRLLVNTLVPRKGTFLGHHRYLVVKPRMNGANHCAVGAVVRAQVGRRWLTRLITAGTSYLGQEPAEAFFGLGQAPRVNRVIVEWPDGRRSERRYIRADRVLTIRPDDEASPGVTPLNR